MMQIMERKGRTVGLRGGMLDPYSVFVEDEPALRQVFCDEVGVGLFTEQGVDL